MLIELKNGKKFTIESVIENENGLLRGRTRETLEIVFSAKEPEFAEIQKSFTAENLSEIIVYYPDYETQDSTKEQLAQVAQKQFEAYQLIGEWRNIEKVKKSMTREKEDTYYRQLSVLLGQLQYGEELVTEEER